MDYVLLGDALGGGKGQLGEMTNFVNDRGHAEIIGMTQERLQPVAATRLPHSGTKTGTCASKLTGHHVSKICPSGDDPRRRSGRRSGRELKIALSVSS